jgi:hypothetical protein
LSERSRLNGLIFQELAQQNLLVLVIRLVIDQRLDQADARSKGQSKWYQFFMTIGKFGKYRDERSIDPTLIHLA